MRGSGPGTRPLRRSVFTAAVACALALAGVAGAGAKLPHGAPDPGFSDLEGRVLADLGRDEYAAGVVVQVDGKVVIAGAANNGSDIDVAVWRFNPDGSPDTSFGTNGHVTTPIGASGEGANAVALQKDGKIVVAGFSTATHAHFAVVRYTKTGQLDTTFNGTGIVTTTIDAAGDSANGVAIQKDGKIVAAGWTIGATETDMAVARYLPTGALDTTFNGTGTKVIPFATNYNAYANGVAIQSDGKIVLGGYMDNSADYDFAAARLNANGTLDGSFDGGKVSRAVGTGNDIARSIAIAPNGTIVLGGEAQGPAADEFGVMRLTKAGMLDTSFSSNGTELAPVNGINDVGWAVGVQKDGKIVLGGKAAFGGADDRFAVARFLAGGGLDPSFGTAGVVAVKAGASSSEIEALTIQKDGKIVAAGETSNGTNYDAAVARFKTSGALDAFTSRPGTAVTHFGATGDQANGVVVQPDGKVVAVGSTATSLFDSDWALARYGTDGTLDPTFGTGGKRTTSFGSDFDTANAVAFQEPSGIVVAGSSTQGGSPEVALARYHVSDGTLDTSFGGSNNGKELVPYNDSSNAYAVAIQPADGKILVAGYESAGANEDAVLERFNPDGGLDTSFNGSGIANLDRGSVDMWQGIALQKDGKIVVCGSTNVNGDHDFLIARYLPGGGLDPTFGTGGVIVRNTFNAFDDYCKAVAVQKDGRILAAGTTYTGSAYYDTVFGLTPTGGGDPKFNGGIADTINLGSGSAGVGGVAVDSSGRVLVGGYGDLGAGQSFFLLRYAKDGHLDPTFGTSGETATFVDGMGSGAFALATRSDGGVVLAGESPGGSSTNFAVVRYVP